MTDPNRNQDPPPAISATPWSSGLQDLESWERAHAAAEANQAPAPPSIVPAGPTTPPAAPWSGPVHHEPAAGYDPTLDLTVAHAPDVPWAMTPSAQPTPPPAPDPQAAPYGHQPQPYWQTQPWQAQHSQPQHPQVQQPQRQLVWDDVAQPVHTLASPEPTGGRAQTYSADALIGQLAPATSTVSRRSWRNRIGLGASAKEQAEQLDEQLVRTPFDRPVTIMVANPKGGVGKTPMSLLLAAAFGVVRGGGVCAWDNNELRGTMPDRSVSLHRRTVRDVLAARDALQAPQSQMTDVAQFLNHQPSGKFHTLGSAQNSGHVISKTDFETIHTILTRYFSIVVVDTGNNEASPNWLAAAHQADCLVVPTKWRKDSLIPAARMLETLQSERSDLLNRTIVVATNGPMDSQPEVRKSGAQWFGGERQIVEIPTDPHIAEGNIIEYDKLKPRTQRQALRLAAQVAQLLATVARRPPGQA